MKMGTVFSNELIKNKLVRLGLPLHRKRMILIISKLLIVYANQWEMFPLCSIINGIITHKAMIKYSFGI